MQFISRVHCVRKNVEIYFAVTTVTPAAAQQALDLLAVFTGLQMHDTELLNLQRLEFSGPVRFYVVTPDKNDRPLAGPNYEQFDKFLRFYFGSDDLTAVLAGHQLAVPLTVTIPTYLEAHQWHPDLTIMRIMSAGVRLVGLSGEGYEVVAGLLTPDLLRRAISEEGP